VTTRTVNSLRLNPSAGATLTLNSASDVLTLATGGLRADLTLWLDVSVAESCRRRGGQASDRIEAGGWEFLSRVRGGFAAVMAGQQGWTLVKAEHSEAAVTKACCRAMVRTFGGRA
jgi:dTMP kinase